MRPTGPRSRTERTSAPRSHGRPGRTPGRPVFRVVVSSVLLALVVWPSVASASELLSWWRRDLVDVRFEPGDFATYAQVEITEDGALVDTVTVHVYAAEVPERRWLELRSRGAGTVDRILLRPDALRRDGDPLAAVDSLLRRERDGRWIVEDVESYRDRRLVRRHLTDPFVDPQVERTALTDSTIASRTISRERVRLVEERREERTIGRSTLVVRTRLRAEATISPQVPLAGLLTATTLSTVTTTTEGEGSARSRRAAPPLVTERRLECLEFGHDSARRLLPGGP